MPTIIDELILKLGIDDAEFKRGSRELNEGFRRSKDTLGSHLKTIDENTRKTGEAIRGLGKQALEFFAILTGARGLTEFIANITQANTAMGNLAGTIAASPQTLSAWGTAVEKFGGSAQAMAGTFARINDMIENWRNLGKTPDLPFFQLFSKTGVQAPNQFDTPEVWLQRISEAIKRINDQLGSGEAGFYARVLGIDPATTALMEQQGANITKYTEQFKKLAPTDDEIKNSQKLTSAWVEASAAATAFGREIVDVVSGPLTRMLEITSKILENMIGVRDSQKTTIDQVSKELAEGKYDPAHTGGRDLRGGWAVLQDILHGNKPGSYGKGWGDNVAVGGAPVSDSNPLPVKPVVPPTGDTNPWDVFMNGLGSGLGGIARGIGSFFGGGGGGGDGSAVATATSTESTDIPKEGRALLDAISSGESPGYNVLNGGGTFSDYSHHPGYRAAGRYQFIPSTWEKQKRRLGLTDFSPKSQDAAAWDDAQQVYAHRTGRNLLTDLQNGYTDQVANALSGEWISIPGEPFIKRYQANLDKYNRLEAAARPDMLATDADKEVARMYLEAGKAGAMDAARMSRQAIQSSGSVSNNNNSRNTHIDSLNIYPNTSDGKQFGEDFYRHLGDNGLATMGSYGGI
jgi:muramidase (phage lysozyme)